jgi:hypothetical protein
MHMEGVIYSVSETIVCMNNIELEKCVVIDGYIYIYIYTFVNSIKTGCIN